MSSQTLIHNMRCQNQLQLGEKWKLEQKGNATSHIHGIHNCIYTKSGESGDALVTTKRGLENVTLSSLRTVCLLKRRKNPTRRRRAAGFWKRIM